MEIHKNHKPPGIFKVKLNIGGFKFETTLETLKRFGENLLTQMISGTIPAVPDEEGYYFIDRNGANFGPILDYLRTSNLILPKNIPFQSVIADADYFSIDLSFAFSAEFQEGCYKSTILDHLGLGDILLIEREPNNPWEVGITGIVKEEIDRIEVWTEFWKKRCSILNGTIELDRNFKIYLVEDNLIKIKQLDVIGREKELKLYSRLKSEPDISILTGTWKGDRFMTNSDYLQMSFLFLILDESEERKQLIVNLRCGNDVIGPLPVHVLCDKFFVVSTIFGAFWGLIGTKTDRIQCYRPFCKELVNGFFCEI